MANRQKYTVIVPFPTGGGHWSTKGAELELLDVQARQLVTAGRLRLTSDLEAEAATEAAVEAAATSKSVKKSTTQKGE